VPPTEKPEPRAKPEKTAKAKASVKQESAAPRSETTVEIELPQEVPIEEIERTLSELEARRPVQPKRRWRFGAGSRDEEPGRSDEEGALDEALRQENEFRLAAEHERHRREREYQRSLRDRVK
jgi:hypothetical protein